MSKKLVAMVAAAAATMGIAQTASAQVISPVGGTGTVTGTLSLQQTLIFPITCNVNSPPVSVVSSSLVSTTFPSFPYPICTFPYSAISANANWTIVPLSSTQVSITIPSVNALGGICGPGKVLADVVQKGPPLVLSIPRQQIPGTDSSGNPYPCWVSGTVTVSGVSIS